MCLEKPAENLGHPVGRLLFIEALQSGAFKCAGIGLEDPGRAAGFVLIGMRNERAPFGLLEDKSEGIKRPGRAHPGEHVGAHIDLGLEMRDMLFAETAVDAIGDHNKVGIGKTRLI